MCMCWGWRGSKKRGYEQGLGEEKGWGMGGRDVAGKSAKNCLNGEGFVQENMKRRNSHPIITPHFPTPIVTGPSIIYETISKKIDLRTPPSFVCVCVGSSVIQDTHTRSRQQCWREGGEGGRMRLVCFCSPSSPHTHTLGVDGWV